MATHAPNANTFWPGCGMKSLGFVPMTQRTRMIWTPAGIPVAHMKPGSRAVTPVPRDLLCVSFTTSERVVAQGKLVALTL